MKIWCRLCGDFVGLVTSKSLQSPHIIPAKSPQRPCTVSTRYPRTPPFLHSRLPPPLQRLHKVSLMRLQITTKPVQSPYEVPNIHQNLTIILTKFLRSPQTVRTQSRTIHTKLHKAPTKPPQKLCKVPQNPYKVAQSPPKFPQSPTNPSHRLPFMP